MSTIQTEAGLPPSKYNSVLIVSDADLSEPTAGKTRIISLAAALQKQQINVSLMGTLPLNSEPIAEARELKLQLIQPQTTGSPVGYFRLIKSIIREVKKVKKEDILLQVEGSVLGGYLAMAGLSGFVLDVNDLVFPGLRYGQFFFCKPPLLYLYQWYISRLEKLAVRRACRVIAVSNVMKDFLVSKWHVPETKITVIPNGYFESKATRFRNTKETPGMVAFIGYLIKWARPDKVIAAARALKDDDITFYIIGDGPYRHNLEAMVKEQNIASVVFTGFIPVDKAYEVLAKSEVVLFPFARSLFTQASCPVKLLDYMGLGKAMVIDEVSEIASILKDNDAALVCHPDNDNEFIASLRRLSKDSTLRARLGQNAKRLATDFTWEKQGEKLVRLIREM